MSRAFSPVIPRRGSAQKGWSMLVNWSPYAMAMMPRGKSNPKAWQDSSTSGPCTAHWPPPLGTKTLRTPDEVNKATGSQAREVAPTKPSANHVPNSVPVTMPMMPK